MLFSIPVQCDNNNNLGNSLEVYFGIQKTNSGYFENIDSLNFLKESL